MNSAKIRRRFPQTAGDRGDPNRYERPVLAAMVSAGDRIPADPSSVDTAGLIHLVALAASRMTWVTVPGREIKDRTNSV